MARLPTTPPMSVLIVLWPPALDCQTSLLYAAAAGLGSRLRAGREPAAANSLRTFRFEPLDDQPRIFAGQLAVDDGVCEGLAHFLADQQDRTPRVLDDLVTRVLLVGEQRKLSHDGLRVEPEPDVGLVDLDGRSQLREFAFAGP